MIDPLQHWLDDDEPYPDFMLESLKRRNNAALHELDLSKADMSDLALITRAQQQQLAQLRALATTLGAAIPASEAVHTAIYEAIAGVSARIAAAEARLAALEARTFRFTGARRYLPTLAITTGTDYVLTWDTPFPDTTYQVVPMHSGGVLNATVAEKPGSRTTTGITYRVTNPALISVGGTIAAVAATNS